MGGKTGSGRARRLASGGQAALGFDVRTVTAVAPVPGVVVFNDPAPDRIMAGTMFLSEFVSLYDLGWVREMRAVLRAMDWSSYVARYKPGGRQPYHPAALVGLILLGFLTGRTSLRQLEEMARTDVRAWWLTGGVMPDFTSLCRFITRHAEDLTDATFEALTRKIVRILGSKADSLFMDGTVVQAAASRWQLLKQEAAKQAADEARAAADLAPDDKGLAEKAKLAETVHETVQERDRVRVAKGRKPDAQIAPHEPEAVMQQLKEGGYAPSYKPSAAANSDRIIVGKHVEASNECKQVEVMLAQAERVTEAPVLMAALDAGYNSAEVFEVMARHGVEFLCPEGKTNGGDESWVENRTLIGKDKFTYDAERDVYTCPQGRVLTLFKRCKSSERQPAYARYQSADCSDCPLAATCLRKSKPRTIKRFAHDGQKEALRAKMSHPQTKRRYRRRQGSVEPVHGEQKNIQGMRRFRRKGLVKVRLEYSLHCMAHNLRRFRALRQKRAGAAAGTGSGGDARARTGRTTLHERATRAGRLRRTSPPGSFRHSAWLQTRGAMG